MQLKDTYGDRIIERGENYTHRVNYCLKIGDFLYSEVEGSHTYKTKVNLKTLEGDCSCPYSSNCKHAVATYLIHKDGDSIQADQFTEHLKTLSKRELIKIIVDNLQHNPDIALNYDLQKSTNFESFVNDFIDNFSYSKMNKAEKLVSAFTFEQLLRIFNYLLENEEDVFDKIYEDYYDSYDEGDVLYDFEAKLREEIFNKVTNESEIKQALKIGCLYDEIIYQAQNLIQYKNIIKSVFSKEQFLKFLLNLDEPEMREIEKSITKENKGILYHLPSHKLELAQKIGNHLNDRKLLFLVAVYKEDYQVIINNLPELNKIVSNHPYMLGSRLSNIIDLFLKHNFKDKKLAKKLLQKRLLKEYDRRHLIYLVKQIDDYDFINKLVDFQAEFSQTRILLARLFQLNNKSTKNILDKEKTLLKNKHWTEIVDILNFIKASFGINYMLRLIKKNETVFKTSSSLKSNLKKEGIFISNIKGVLNIELKDSQPSEFSLKKLFP